MTEESKRVYHAGRAIVDVASMTLTIPYSDGTSHVFKPGDFPDEINKFALLSGLAKRIRQDVSDAADLSAAKKAVDATVAQLKSGVWSAQPAPNERKQLAQAYMQIAEEAGKSPVWQNKAKSGLYDQVLALSEEAVKERLAKENIKSALLRFKAAKPDNAVNLDDLG